MHRSLMAVILVAAIVLPTASQAKTLRWAGRGDILTMDPHAQNEGLTNTISSYVYEPLVAYDQHFKIVPGLAVSWEQPAPTIWRFALREGVKFHDGIPFTANDVVFSIQRARGPASRFKVYVNSIVDARRVDDLTVELVTSSPNPILLRQLTNVFIMSRAWAEKHNAVTPHEASTTGTSLAAHHANGTGPYKLESHEAEGSTIFTEYADWWNKRQKIGNVSKVVYTPIKQDTARAMALLSGDIDFVLDPAAQYLGRLRQQAKVVESNEYRTLFLGFDQKSPELKYANVKGKNPFADLRVREALYRAIDTTHIKKFVMRGAASPTGTMIAPQVHGWTESLNRRVPHDPDKARALLKEAGYPNTLEFTLDCPNNRYMNDEAICQAIVSMWSKVGVKATLNALPSSAYFPKLQAYDTSAYLLGWGVPTFDALYTLQSLIHSPGEGADGAFNLSGYANPDVDALIDQIKTELDPAVRDEAIHKALTLHANDFGHIPLHNQIIPWAMRKNVHAVHRADNRLSAEWVVID